MEEISNRLKGAVEQIESKQWPCGPIQQQPLTHAGPSQQQRSKHVAAATWQQPRRPWTVQRQSAFLPSSTGLVSAAMAATWSALQAPVRAINAWF
ncbi:hypothetical protein V6N13_078060 [Hibiscus sabdariffa]